MPTKCHSCREARHLERVLEWGVANPEKVTGAKRRYKAANPNVWDLNTRRVAWVRNLKRRYNLSLDDYHRILAAQNGVCAVCKGPPRGRGADEDRFHIDHCHTSGIVRGLLCSPCNMMLGLAGEDPTTLASAIEYLKTHAAPDVVRVS